MKKAVRILFKMAGLLSLLLLTIPSFLFLFEIMNLDRVKVLMFSATLIWFVSASVLLKVRS